MPVQRGLKPEQQQARIRALRELNPPPPPPTPEQEIRNQLLYFAAVIEQVKHDTTLGPDNRLWMARRAVIQMDQYIAQEAPCVTRPFLSLHQELLTMADALGAIDGLRSAEYIEDSPDSRMCEGPNGRMCRRLRNLPP